MEVNTTDATWRNEAWEDAKRGKSYAIFREDTVKDNMASEKAGRPIYKPVILLEKIVPGDSLNRPIRPMRDSDKEEYPQEWARFQQNKTNQIPGTPVEAVTWLSKTQVAEFRAINIFTVEQLATLPDSVASRIMGFQEIRAKAQSFLKASQDSAFTTRLEAELKGKDEKISALEARLAALEQQPAAPQPKRGRPKKATAPMSGADTSTAR